MNKTTRAFMITPLLFMFSFCCTLVNAKRIKSHSTGFFQTSFKKRVDARKADAISYKDIAGNKRVQYARINGATQVILDRKFEKFLSIKQKGNTRWNGLSAKRLHPWKLLTADVDGDGNREIVIGVYKSTRFYPYKHPCLFIYKWTGRSVEPLWRGSGLSRPFIDFHFMKQRHTAMETLVSTEILPNKWYCISAYQWNGFGFTGIWQHGNWRNVQLITAQYGRITLRINNKIHRINITHKEQNI